MKRKATLTGANTVFFAFAVIYIIFQILLIFANIIVSIVYGEKYAQNFLTDNIYTIMFITQFFVVLCPVLIYSFYKKLNFKSVFRLSAPGILPVIIIILAAIPAYSVALMLNTAVIYCLQFIGNIPVQSLPVPMNIPELIIGILFVAVTPAICEEMMHRGLFLSGYENRGSMKAVVISSIVFGIFHFDISNLAGPIFLGLLIGYYVIRTNSIFSGMLAHFLNNAIAEILQYSFRNSILGDSVLTVSLSELIGSVIRGAIGMLLLAFLIYVFKKVTYRRSIIRPSISSLAGDLRAMFTHWPIIVVIVIYVLFALLYIFAIASAKLFGI